MNLTIDPCTDFFQYACGNWNRMHQIPENKSAVSVLTVMSDKLQVVLKGLLEDPINSKDNEATQKAKMFYNSCTNLNDIRKVGNEPIREIIGQLGGWPVLSSNWSVPSFSLETLLANMTSNYGTNYIIDQSVDADEKNSSTNIVQIFGVPLGLPSRDYYIKMSSKNHLDAYYKYMTNIAILFGANATTAGKELLEVIEFEKKLAKASSPKQDQRDRSKAYHKMALTELSTIVPQVNWLEYFRSIYGKEMNETENIVVDDLPYFKELGIILAKTGRQTIHNYVMSRLVMDLSSYLIDDYQKEELMFKQIVYGIKSGLDRWFKCVKWVKGYMGMAVGALYVREHFDQDSKVEVVQMIDMLREAFNELLVENEWMDEETKKVAKEKANAMGTKVGYPQLVVNDQELCKKYQLLNTSDNGFLKNMLNAMKFEAQTNFKKLRQPVDKKQWDQGPAIVNAFYSPRQNAIEIPAALLQPLIYSKISPKSLNYGGIGVIIGHEITHGFDDSGRQFDKDGNLRQWWNNATIKAFREKAQCITDKYSRYKVTDGNDLHINGKLTLGENIADNGGLKQSYRAYRNWVSQHGEEMQLPGLNLTHDQLFFLNFAQTWCSSIRPERALLAVRSDTHSLGPMRVVGSLSSSQDFAKAYSCPVGSPMNPSEKCSVW
nr:unnamed protein product [Callosobruchus analis]